MGERKKGEGETQRTFLVRLIAHFGDAAGHAGDEGGGTADAFWVEIAGCWDGVVDAVV